MHRWARASSTPRRAASPIGTWTLPGTCSPGSARGADSSFERSAADEAAEEPDPDAEAEEQEGDSGSQVRLKTWAQRKHKGMGHEAPGGQPVPLIDRVHRLMHLWRAGDVHRVDEYLDDNGLRRQELFRRLVQSLIELSQAGSEERTLLESLSNHIGARGPTLDAPQVAITYGQDG